MKKTIFTTTLVLGLGAAGVAADQNAEAAEVNEAELAQKAQSESSELNNSPLHEGEYQYNFNLDGVNYNFESDGTNFSWSYGGGNNEQPQEEVNEPEQAPVEETQEQAQPAENNDNNQEQQAQQNNEQQEEQPQQNNEQQEQSQDEAQAPAPSGGSQDWGALAQCESGGDPNAVSPSGAYHGLYQFDQQTWESVGGSGSPSDASAEEQTQRAQQLHSDRGSQPWPVCGANL